jgi:hypothetical protein
MALKYPTDCTTSIDKIEFCYIAQETLRLDHNIKGKDFRDGKLTETEWNTYREGIFRPKSMLISEEILAHREELKKSTKWVVDLDSLGGIKV